MVQGMRTSFKSFTQGLILAVVLLYLILVAQFRSFRDPFIILLAVPPGLASSALLVVDHYLDVEYDLSQVFFVATANVMHTIPPALQDRMEVLRLHGYTEQEKVEIAKQFLVKKQMVAAGLSDKNIKFLQLPEILEKRRPNDRFCTLQSAHDYVPSRHVAGKPDATTFRMQRRNEWRGWKTDFRIGTKSRVWKRYSIPSIVCCASRHR